MENRELLKDESVDKPKKKGRNKKEYFFYVIPDLETWVRIKESGLKAGKDGYIHLFTDKKISTYVAVVQHRFRTCYGLIKIDRAGITVEVEPDNFVFYSMIHIQRRVKQEVILPNYIDLINMYWVNAKDILKQLYGEDYAKLNN